MIWSEPAPAKVNLTLHVTGQRDDGYHMLDSLVVFTQAGDMLYARRGQGVSLELTGPERAALGDLADNLVLRAARQMGATQLALTLEKNLPVASGIGGGSADAAACLRLVAKAIGKDVPKADALAQLGADVPVCALSRPCRMQGIGAQIAPVTGLPDFALLLVNPRVPVPTPHIFKTLACKTNPAMAAELPVWSGRADFFAWLSQQRNDLQPPAIQIAPEIEAVLASLEALKDCKLARMSGSGATCFGVFDDLAGARLAAQVLACAQPDWWIMPTAVLRA